MLAIHYCLCKLTKDRSRHRICIKSSERLNSFAFSPASRVVIGGGGGVAHSNAPTKALRLVVVLNLSRAACLACLLAPTGLEARRGHLVSSQSDAHQQQQQREAVRDAMIAQAPLGNGGQCGHLLLRLAGLMWRRAANKNRLTLWRDELMASMALERIIEIS